MLLVNSCVILAALLLWVPSHCSYKNGGRPLYIYLKNGEEMTKRPVVTNLEKFSEEIKTEDVVKDARDKYDDDDTCLTDGCREAAEEFSKSIDTSVDPCEDFYQYSCGNWIKNNPLPSSEPAWGTYNKMSIQNKKLVKSIFENRSNGSGAIKKVYNFYDSCMDTDRINKRGTKPLMNLLKSVASSPSLKLNLTKVLVKLHKETAVSPLFSLDMSPDFKDAVNWKPIIQESGIESREMYLSDEETYVKTRAAYKTLMKKLTILLGAPDNDAIKQQVDEMYTFEEELAKIMMPTIEKNDYNKNYFKTSVGELKKWANIPGFSWSNYLKKIFNKIKGSKVISDDTEIVTFSKKYLEKLGKLIQDTPSKTVSNYIIFRVVRDMASYLSQPFTDALFEFNKVKQGVTQQEERSLVCIPKTQAAFPQGLGLLYVDKSLPGNSKQLMDGLIKDFQREFKKNLLVLKWLDDSSTQQAVEKVDAMADNVGYPAWIKNSTSLDSAYTTVKSTIKRFFENALSGQKNQRRRTLERFGTTVDRNVWEMSPLVVNAYYDPSQNKLIFPAGILQKPYFEASWPQYLNYGAIGSIIGHEITHGFDNNGAQVNKDGNLKQWMSDESLKQFEKRTKCVIDQYSDYEMYGIKLNGKGSNGEDISDNAGYKFALRAYQEYVKASGPEKKLPGISLTPEQLVFVSAAHVDCTVATKQYWVNSLKNDPHTPGKFRVIGSASNSEDFTKAFNCPVGSKMNPKKRCLVW